MNIIEIKNLSVKYNDHVILKDINLDIRQNEFLGIVGPNGGGKTTFLKVLLGLIKPSQGTCYFKNPCKLGYVPQNSSCNKLFPVNVTQTVLMGLLPGKLVFGFKHTGSDHKLAYKIMEQLDIKKLALQPLNVLSGGEFKKVLIARAIINSPNVLMLDEPMANIDSNTESEIYKLLRELNKNMTIILVSHNLNSLFAHVNRIACINKTLHDHDNKVDIRNEIIKQLCNLPS